VFEDVFGTDELDVVGVASFFASSFFASSFLGSSSFTDLIKSFLSLLANY